MNATFRLTPFTRVVPNDTPLSGPEVCQLDSRRDLQVLGLGYDTQLVLLFDVGCVLSLVFIGGVLQMAYPELYQK